MIEENKITKKKTFELTKEEVFKLLEEKLAKSGLTYEELQEHRKLKFKTL